ncbi:hypothetical protein J7K42_02225 [bacterium]|nr:hypothetical protein [bacterium]
MENEVNEVLVNLEGEGETPISFTAIKKGAIVIFLQKKEKRKRRKKLINEKRRF